jgi:hypothetical protein
MSAVRQMPGRSRVREWHIVTVALRCWSRIEAPEVQGMQGVGILGRLDRLGDLLGRDLPRQWKLDEDAVDGIVGVETLDQGEQVGLRGRLRKQVLGRVGPDPRAGALLAFDVGAARGVVTDQHHREARRAVAGGHQLGDLLGHLVAKLVREAQAIDDDGLDLLRRHQAALFLDLADLPEPPDLPLPPESPELDPPELPELSEPPEPLAESELEEELESLLDSELLAPPLALP